MPTINNASRKTLSGVFDRSVFDIPKYQRAYSWEESNWKELWDDVKGSVVDKDKEHFLGAVIYYHGNAVGSSFSHYEVIDGQQRLTTITILMRVLYEKLKESKEEVYSRFADELYENYIGSLSNDTYYLNLSKKDELFFKDHIQKIAPVRRQGKLISNKKIRKCYEYFVKKVDELRELEKETKFEEVCWNFKKKIEKNIVFVVIDVTTDVDAYIIFESINSKRQGLTISDLLKNYIFSSADQYERVKPDSRKLSITEDAWDRMEQDLDKIEINQYIRHFWISKFGKVSEKELYQEIKSKFKNDFDSVLDFFESLTSESESYSSIINANILNFSFEGLHALGQLYNLRNRQFYPLILSAISNEYNAEEVSALIKEIASVAIRRAIIGKNPNELEAFFTNNASKLRNGHITIPELISELSKDYWILDDEISREIRTATFEDQEYLAKFILKEFEISKNPAMEKTLGKVSLEHVLPRTPDKVSDWNMSEKQQEEVLWNIGNLALIGQKYNSKMSNKSFKQKRPWLKKTEIRTTVILAAYEDWTETEVMTRNAEIAKFICDWWPNLKSEN